MSLACRALLLLVLALPCWTWALDFGFKAPRDPDDPAAVEAMRDLAQRIVPVYQDADTDGFLANVTALQIVSGSYGAAYDTSMTLRGRYQGKPFDGLAERAIHAVGGRARAGPAGVRSLAREGQPSASRCRGARAHLAGV